MKYTNLTPSDVDLLEDGFYQEMDEVINKMASKKGKKVVRVDRSNVNDKRNDKRHSKRTEWTPEVIKQGEHMEIKQFAKLLRSNKLRLELEKNGQWSINQNNETLIKGSLKTLAIFLKGYQRGIQVVLENRQKKEVRI